MNLSDLTKELFDYVVAFRQRVRESSMPAITEIAHDFQSVFAKMDTTAQRHSSLMSAYQQVKYPLVALADEVVLTSEWSEAKDWEHYLLENKYFSTNVAGNQFFKLLEHAEQMDVEVLKVFFNCLAFGFSGAFSPTDPSLLRLRARLSKKIQPEEGAVSPERLFPAAYTVNLGQATKLKRLWRWWHIVVVLVLFFTFLVLIESLVIWPIILGDIEDDVETAKAVSVKDEAKPVETSEPVKNEGSGYTLQLGLFNNEADARNMAESANKVVGNCKIILSKEPGEAEAYYVISGHFFSIEKAVKSLELIKKSVPIRSDSGIVEMSKLPGKCILGC